MKKTHFQFVEITSKEAKYLELSISLRILVIITKHSNKFSNSFSGAHFSIFFSQTIQTFSKFIINRGELFCHKILTAP